MTRINKRTALPKKALLNGGAILDVNAKLPATVCWIAQDRGMTELDRIDVALLGAVQKNNRLTSEELAEIVNLSPTACQRRLKRLRAERVIEADVAIVSPKAVGRHITMIVLVSLERERADIVDRFKAAIRNTHEVMIGFYVTGDADFILIVTAKDMEDYEEFTRRFFYENHDIKGFKTMVVMDRVKASFAVPLEVTQHLAQTPGK